ncbi:tetratricopeptide repeat protein [Prosthecochloris sp.]|uniref:CHAT domain-containing protein n=1 Tax=Prosthecochloris sp. TaxID=290513 RepID=UPI0025EF2AE8|nr:tetratricopeptide repeat protein [Prosthecochloris sp.]
MNTTVGIIRHIVLVSVVFVAAACAKSEKEPAGEGRTVLYEKAAVHAANHDYEKALELLNKGLARDTLDGFSPETAEVLNRKSVIEALTGDYFDALASHEVIEQRCKGMLADSVEAERIRRKALLLSELGEFSEAEKALMKISAMSVQDSLKLAFFQIQAGEYEKAFALYKGVSGNTDPLISLQAYTGMLELSLDESFEKPEAPSFYVHKSIGLARRLLDGERKGTEMAEALALRRTAMLLEMFPAHVENASYLYFKALARARLAGEERLVQLLDFESNAVLANNPEVYARTLDYFERNNMPLAKMVVLLKQGTRSKMDDAEKIKALKKGLSIYQYQHAPYPGYAIDELFDRSTETLVELLLSKGRYAEAFEYDELKKLYVLKQTVLHNYDSLELSGKHEKLAFQVERLGLELSALLQRSMNCFESGRGYDKHAVTIDAINKKRGRFYEKLGALRSVSPLHAERLVLTPVTLRTVQQTLDDNHAVLKIIEGKHWCTVFLVQNGNVDVSRRKINATHYRSRLGLLTERLAMSAGTGIIPLARDPERLWLTDLLIKPYTGRLQDMERLTVIAGEPVPAHLLGNNRFLVRDFPVSWIYSANELVYQASLKEENDIEGEFAFYGVEKYRDALERKLTHPRQAVFLLWKHFSDAELDEIRVLLTLSLQQGGDPSGMLHQLVQNKQAESEQWFYVSEYGMR